MKDATSPRFAPGAPLERRMRLAVLVPLALSVLFAAAVVGELVIAQARALESLVAATVVGALLLGTVLGLFARRQLRAVAAESHAAELEQRVAELAAANQELEAFSYSVSHDLRGPLRAIDGFSQILLEQYRDKLDQQGQHFLARMRAGSQRMWHLIDDLLSLARITRAEMHRSDVDLAQLAREVVDDLRRDDPGRAVDVAIVGEARVRGDAPLLRAALVNLLGNAWKFTSKTAAPKIELGCDRRDGVATYYVRDNGAGFDMVYAHKLFAPFQRLHQQSEFEGTGIGLATVHRIITRHGGTLWAESAPGHGATFWFTLGRS
jgi:light-regulated signal transduction histidine kinase (bacteriophytochrome)